MTDLPPMPAATVDFFYDYVDPASYLVDRILVEAAADRDVRISPRPFEIRRPPAPMVDARDPDWRRYQAWMEEEAREIDVEMERPRLVPWSRKAHELALAARELEGFTVVHEALFRAYFVEGRDLGRVDVLVEIGVDAGLDPTAVKAALDVDRHRDPLQEERALAERLEVRGVPTLLAGDRKLEGFHPKAEILTFLADVTDGS